ncbi:exonuclease domain-containing protein [Paratractidigestivibacter sp.]|uniref:exonuclease domain-containing protein n=2 Tax=Paratractidigestivibacter sp. TaxID=2847316 RepID=UPI002AC92417|nr:exonuclease domain-containing protein [Paratractidigestivibacter sp.]
MLYSARGSAEMVDWVTAAKRGGVDPENPKPGSPRTYKVSAWIEIGDELAEVSGIWASGLSDPIRKALLKELGLPVKKQLVYRFGNDCVANVADFRIQAVWDGWCLLELLLSDGTRPSLPIHSMYLAEMNKAQTYYVFDLETTGTNPQTAEICEIAAIKVSNDKVVDEFETLVYIDGQMPLGAERVNHISKDMLADATHMRHAMHNFLTFIGDDAVLVGHNIKSFDLPLIERVAALCGLKFTYRQSIDTLDVSKKAWPGRKSYSMESLRPTLDIGAEGAHRALKDCKDELEVYLKARAVIASGKVRPITEAEEKPRPRRASFTSKWSRKKAKEFVANVKEFDEENPLFEKCVVFSGEVEGHDYESCMQIVCDLGGTPQDNVTRKTNFLVRGEGCGEGKTRKAEELKSKGFSVQIIGQEEFCRMVGWE